MYSLIGLTCGSSIAPRKSIATPSKFCVRPIIGMSRFTRRGGNQVVATGGAEKGVAVRRCILQRCVIQILDALPRRFIHNGHQSFRR